MSENLGIELYNELPKFFFGNEKYLLVQGFVKALDSFEKCNLYINNKLVAVSKPSVRYSKVKLKICANLFQFMVELPSLKNEKEVIIELKVIAKNEEQLFQLASIPVKKISQKLKQRKLKWWLFVCLYINPTLNCLNSSYNLYFNNLTKK